DYKKNRAVFDAAVKELQELGAELVDPIGIPDVIDRLNKSFDANVFETEAAIDRYLAAHQNAPFKTLREILLSGLMAPSRARTLMSAVGKSPSDAGYLQVLPAQEALRQLVLVLMADQRLDALVYATFDHQPGIIADDVMTRTVVPD